MGKKRWLGLGLSIVLISAVASLNRGIIIDTEAQEADISENYTEEELLQMAISLFGPSQNITTAEVSAALEAGEYEKDGTLTAIILEQALQSPNVSNSTKEEISSLMFFIAGTRQWTTLGGHFTISYSLITEDSTNGVDTTDSDRDGTPDYIENLGTYLENSWNEIVSNFGFTAPRGSVVSVPVQKIGAYGMTDYCNILHQQMCIWILNSMTDSLVKVTAAHEFFHTVQERYDWNEERWIMEATATWMEDAVYDNVNDYMGYIGTIFSNPDQSVTLVNKDHEYAMVLYFKYISEHYGTDGSGRKCYTLGASAPSSCGVDLIRNLWNEFKVFGSGGISAIDKVLRIQYGSSWSIAYSLWVETNYVKDLGNPFAQGFLDYLEDEECSGFCPYPSITSFVLNQAFPVGANVPISNSVNKWGTDYIALSPQFSDGKIRVSFNGENSGIIFKHDFGGLVLFILPSNPPVTHAFDLGSFLDSNNDATFDQNNQGYDRIVIIIWGRDDGGAYSLSVSDVTQRVQITVTSNPTGNNLVKVDGTQITSPTNFNWAVGSQHTLEALSPASCGSGCQRVWLSWSDGGVRVHTITVPSSPTTYTANYKTQSQITFASNGVSSDSIGTVVGINGNNYAQTQLPYTNWYDAGSTINYAFSDTPTSQSGKRYVWTSTSGLGQTSRTGSFIVGGSGTVTGSYKTQYNLMISVNPSGTGNTNPAPGNYWYDSLSNVLVSSSANSGYRFDHWDLDGTNVGTNPSYNVQMNRAHTLTAYFTVIQAEFDFSISVSPTSNSVQRGNTLSPAGTITLNLISGLTQPVSLSLSGLLGTVGTHDLNGKSCSPNCSINFGISTLANAPSGSYMLTITGTGGGKSHSTTFTLNVTTVPPSNNPPTANNQVVQTNQNTPIAITLTGSDPDNNPLTFSITNSPTNGGLGSITQISPNSARVTYTPNTGFVGGDSFKFKVNDGSSDSPPATVTITIIGGNTGNEVFQGRILDELQYQSCFEPHWVFNVSIIKVISTSEGLEAGDEILVGYMPNTKPSLVRGNFVEILGQYGGIPLQFDPNCQIQGDGLGVLIDPSANEYINKISSSCSSLTPTIVGTDGNDTLMGTEGDDIIFGLDGDDDIDGKGGNDIICAGAGKDQIMGGDGDDDIRGQGGADQIDGGNGDDILRGNGGGDGINGGNDNDLIYGGTGDDSMDGGNGTDSCKGGKGTNTKINCESALVANELEDV